VSPHYRVHVSKDYLVFACAHFVIFDAHSRETMHGHNYRLSVTVDGTLDDYGFVLDFVKLKKMSRRLVDSIDHRVLLAEHAPRLGYEERDGFLHVSYEGKPAYMLPANEVIRLPILNTTVECIVAWFAEKFREEFRAAGYTNLTGLELDLEENTRQSAIIRVPLP